MKKISEVCKIVGITRRTLQEYNRIKLLEYTSMTKEGYWLYDNEAIQKLMLIEIFRQAGYKRLEIKEFINDRERCAEEYDIAQKKLEDQQHRIESMIKNLRMLKRVLYLPESLESVIRNYDISELYKNRSFQETFDQFMETLEKKDSATFEDELIFTEMFFITSIFGMMNKKDIKSKEVRDMFYMFVDSLIKFYAQCYAEGINDIGLERIPEEKFSQIFLEKGLEILEFFSFSEMLNKIFGAETYEFVTEVFKTYSVTRNEVMERLLEYQKEMED